jgi:hypothetical protein
VARVQARRQRARVFERARQLDRLLGEREPPLRLARVVELERQPREQAGPQRRPRVLGGGERVQRLLEQRQPRGVDAAQDRPLSRVAERGAAEQRRVAERARRGRRRQERLARRVLEPRALLSGPRKSPASCSCQPKPSPVRNRSITFGTA